MAGLVWSAIAHAASVSFTGAYSQNFDLALTNAATALPAGFRSVVIGGAKTDYTAANPISTTAIAGAAAATQSAIVWNAGSAVTASGSQLFNVGCWDTLKDRALGTDPTGTGANVIELSLVNNSGGPLTGVVFSYSSKCLTNGTPSSGNGAEAGELPGYAFFYSLTGGTTAAQWQGVPALSLGNYTQGTSSNSGNVTITFSPPLTNSGTMYFRWADDNNGPNSPDQMIAIDDINIISTAADTGPNVPVAVSPAPNAIGVTNHPILTVSVSDPDTNAMTVTFYGRVAGSGGYAVIGAVSGVASGSNALATWFGLMANTAYEWYATAYDGVLASTNAVSQFTTVASFPAIPPTVTLTSPANNSTFSSPVALTLTATAADVDGAVIKVSFFQGSTKLADVTANPYAYYWSGIAGGVYSLTAVATDDNGLMTTSTPVNLSITNSPAVQTLQQIKTVFVIPLENHDWVQSAPQADPQQLFGNPAAPYLNSLTTPGHSNAVQVSYATHYFSTTMGGHPSEPNYIWSEAGTEFGRHTDNDPSFGSANLFENVMHLSGQLTTAGVAWRSYQEDLEYSSSSAVSASGSGVTVNPYNGTTEYYYATKHNPMAFFTDTQNQNCYPLTNFWVDLTNNNIGRYNWVTPDQYNEMHSSLPAGYTYHGVHYTGDQAAIAEGDNALSIIIPKIMASQAYQDHGAIIIWTDETESTDDTNTTLPFVIISPLARGNAYASTLPYSHSSDLKTMDEIFGLAYQTNAIPAEDVDAQNAGFNYVDGRSAGVNDLSDFFQPAAVVVSNQPPKIVSVQVNPADGSFLLTFTAPSGQTYRVLASDTLAVPASTWPVVSTGTFGNTNAIFSDVAAVGHSNRFYEVKSP